jgi:hypothetical protein
MNKKTHGLIERLFSLAGTTLMALATANPPAYLPTTAIKSEETGEPQTTFK